MRIVRSVFAPLLCVILLTLSSCGAKPISAATDLTAELIRYAEDASVPEKAFLNQAADFSFALFREIPKDEAILISPVSVLYALGMCAAGAEGETLAQFEKLFGSNVETFSQNLSRLTARINQSEVCRIANSVWIRDTFFSAVKERYLRDCRGYFETSVFSAPFDHGTAKDMNRWIRDNTEGLIDRFFTESESLPSTTVMYLINTLLLDLDWITPYEEHQLSEGTFKDICGNTVGNATFLNSVENYYLEGYGLYGVRKPYNNGYSFVALLPTDGENIYSLTRELTGEKFLTLLTNETAMTVSTQIPKFDTEFSVSLSDALKALGLTEAFDTSCADFSGIADINDGDNLYVSDVFHKVRLELTEAGTKVASVTVVPMTNKSARNPSKYVILDEPFLYFIVDNATGLPLFMGIYETVSRN